MHLGVRNHVVDYTMKSQDGTIHILESTKEERDLCVEYASCIWSSSVKYMSKKLKVFKEELVPPSNKKNYLITMTSLKKHYIG